MNHGVFSEKMKAADLALANYRLLYVFPCFGLSLGLGESTVRQVCEKNGISVALFLLVCNLYTFEEYYPDAGVLRQIPLDELMQYLRNAHQDYLNNRMPKVIAQVMNLTDDGPEQHVRMLMEFCGKYKQELIVHFDYEEQIVYPYIEKLLEGGPTGPYKIKEYERNHSNLNAALSDLKNILIKYLPPECSVEKCRDVLIDLFLFESDLSKHTLLEDHILIALVEEIERKIR
ncbi:MAG: hemerythrin domain-containing protein [Dysgonamonadaceae bacterium]|jgi:regulator of cell morphogenesis and NO signaling|nr:hemerythrin domain-containing protein [Dysgonamonadaceae bacterium]